MLRDLGATEQTRIEAVNKCDIADPWPSFPGAVMMSAKTGEGLEELKERIAEALQTSYAPVTFMVPFAKYGLLAQIRPQGRVIAEKHTDTGTEITLLMAKEDAARIAVRYGTEIIQRAEETETQGKPV